MRFARIYAPSIVLLTWAAALAAGAHGLGLTLCAMILLAVALAVHIREERRRSSGKNGRLA